MKPLDFTPHEPTQGPPLPRAWTPPWPWAGPRVETPEMLPQTHPQTQPFAPPGVDSELESLVEAKRREWEGKGYPPTLIARALTMAREWPASMFASRLYQAVRGTPAERETQRQLYRMGLDVATRWLAAMHRS